MSDKKILKFRTQGGLCNRLRAIVCASLWAEDLDVDLWIYWPVEPGHMPCALEEILIPGSISQCKKVVAEYLPGAVAVQSVDKMNQFLLSVPDCVAVESYSIFHSDFHKPRGKCLLRSLRLLPEIELAADAMWKSWGGKSKWIGIHIRQTDHVKCIAASPLTEFEEKIRLYLREDSEQKYLLVSDDSSVLEGFEEKFGKETIITHRFPLGRKDKIQQIHGVIDWLLLQKVGLLFGSAGSSFSELAAWRSGGDLYAPRMD